MRNPNTLLRAAVVKSDSDTLLRAAVVKADSDKNIASLPSFFHRIEEVLMHNNSLESRKRVLVRILRCYKTFEPTKEPADDEEDF